MLQIHSFCLVCKDESGPFINMCPLTAWHDVMLHFVSRGRRRDITGRKSFASRFLLVASLVLGAAFLAAAAAAAAASPQSCLTLCDPVHGSPPGSPVPGILQARTLEWVAISFSNVWKWKVKVKSLSRVRLLATPWTAAYQAPLSMGFSRQEYWSGVPSPSPQLSLDVRKNSLLCLLYSQYFTVDTTRLHF